MAPRSSNKAFRESKVSERVRHPGYAIGRITEERGIMVKGKPLEARGFDHFA
jgi:hypothetical protein